MAYGRHQWQAGAGDGQTSVQCPQCVQQQTLGSRVVCVLCSVLPLGSEPQDRASLVTNQRCGAVQWSQQQQHHRSRSTAPQQHGDQVAAGSGGGGGGDGDRSYLQVS